MSEQSSVGERAKQEADRVGVRVAELQALGKRILERVPAPLRRGMRRAFSLAFFIAIGWVLYGQLRELDWPQVLRSLPTSPWFYVCFLARYLILPVTEALCYSPGDTSDKASRMCSTVISGNSSSSLESVGDPIPFF